MAEPLTSMRLALDLKEVEVEEEEVELEEDEEVVEEGEEVAVVFSGSRCRFCARPRGYV